MIVPVMDDTSSAFSIVEKYYEHGWEDCLTALYDWHTAKLKTVRADECLSTQLAYESMGRWVDAFFDGELSKRRDAVGERVRMRRRQMHEWADVIDGRAR